MANPEQLDADLSVDLDIAVIVIDGDTIDVDGERIRIMGLDAPETHHAKCVSERWLGRMAKRHLEALLKTGEMRIERRRKDKYNRVLARVFVGGVDVAGLMIRDGLAYEYHGGRRRRWCR